MKIALLMFFALITGIWIAQQAEKERSTKRQYTCRIIHGRGKICYESEMKVDSFRLLTPWNAIVYVGGDSLKVNADWIEFHNQ